MTMLDNAKTFFEACETGQGAEACAPYCEADATFSCQAEALAEITTLSAYADWMKGLLTPVPDGHYKLKGFAADEERGLVMAFAVFHGTNTGEGGPPTPTGQSTASDYVYAMEFAGGKIAHMTKVWNDTHALKELGWA